MINPFRALWRQFTGSQVNAIFSALYAYFHDSFDDTLEYFRQLSIATAKEDHLTLLGIFQGLARPLLPIPDEQYFVFSEVYDLVEDPDRPGHFIPEWGFPSRQGFANKFMDDLEDTGKFNEVEVKGQYSYINPVIFRALLKANSESEGILGSLATLDDLLYGMWKQNHPTTPPAYTFTFVKEGTETRNLPGDIVVDLGVTGDWNAPYEVQAEVRLLGKTIYYPVPKITPKMVVGDSQVDPIGVVRILLRADVDESGQTVYGLREMWNGEGAPDDTAPGEDPIWDMAPLTTADLINMWNSSTTWIDEEGPAEDFTALTTNELLNMWL